MYTQSDQHESIGTQIQQVVAAHRTLNDIKRVLKQVGIVSEDLQLANCRTLNIYTGGSGYDIVGYSIIQKGGKISVEEIIH